jgi:hypothetical protein
MSLLALTLRDAAARSATLADLQRAVAAARAAVDLTEPNHPELAGHLSNLSIMLRRRGQRTDCDPAMRARDLDDAVKAARLATAAGTADEPGHTMDLIALGDALDSRYTADRHIADRDEALTHWQQAANARAGAPTVRTAAAQRWGQAARSHGLVTEALDGYTAAIQLLPIVAWHGLERAAQEYQLTNFGELAAAATEAAISANRPERAVELAEHGRAVLWAQQLHLRTDLTHLAEYRPDLADQLDRVRRLLDQDGSRLPRPATS